MSSVPSSTSTSSPSRKVLTPKQTAARKSALDQAGEAWSVSEHGLPAFCVGYSGDGWSYSSASCGEPITQPDVGRPRLYHHDACRAGAYRRRRALRERERLAAEAERRRLWLASPDYHQRALAAEVRRVIQSLNTVGGPIARHINQLEKAERAKTIERVARARGHLAALADEMHADPLPVWEEPIEQPPTGWVP